MSVAGYEYPPSDIVNAAFHFIQRPVFYGVAANCFDLLRGRSLPTYLVTGRIAPNHNRAIQGPQFVSLQTHSISGRLATIYDSHQPGFCLIAIPSVGNQYTVINSHVIP